MIGFDRVPKRWTLRIVPTVFSGVVGTFLAAMTLNLLARTWRYSPLVDGVLRVWGRLWLVPAGVRLQVEGREHLQVGQSYVIVANHQSILDAMVHLVALGFPMRILAKQELFRIPVLGSAMRAIGMVEVDRANPNFVAINRFATDAFSAGRSLLVYPEGTTSKDGTLGRFKDGAFSIAIAHGIPILPVVIDGTRSVWMPGSNSIHGGQVRVVITEPISTGELTRGDVAQLRADVRTLISSTLEDRSKAPS